MRRSVLPLVLVLAFLAAPPVAGAYVFWTSPTGAVGRIGNDGTDPRPALIAAGAETAPIAADAAHLYYGTDQEDEEGGAPIARTDLDGAAGTLLPEGPLSLGTGGIGAVDAGHIYWADSTGIGRAKLDGSEQEPDFIHTAAAPEIGGIAVYDGFVYWTYYNGGFGDLIGRANLSTKAVDETFVELTEEFGPRAIAVDADGIYWVWEGEVGSEGLIGHVGLGGGTPTLNAIPGIHAIPMALAISGSDLYWINFQEGSGASLAHAELGGAASTIDLHLVDHIGPGYLAANSVSAPPAPPPPPPPSPPGSEPTSGTGSGSSSAASPAATAPPAPTPPPRLAVPKLKLDHKAGTATLTLAAPGPGELVLSGAGLKTQRKGVKAAGPVTLTVRPTAKTTAALRRTGKAKLAAKLTFTPPSGSPAGRVVDLTLRLG
jgi:hypothetical protein